MYQDVLNLMLLCKPQVLQWTNWSNRTRYQYQFLFLKTYIAEMNDAHQNHAQQKTTHFPIVLLLLDNIEVRCILTFFYIDIFSKEKGMDKTVSSSA